MKGPHCVARANDEESDRHVIGLISDTHGLIRPQALEALRGVDLIIHAGDIGKREVIDALQDIAPILAIRGNNDIGRLGHCFPETKLVKSGNTRLFVIHNVNELRCDPVARGYQVVVSGHSHKPSVSTRDGVLFVNPGSCGTKTIQTAHRGWKTIHRRQPSNRCNYRIACIRQ